MVALECAYQVNMVKSVSLLGHHADKLSAEMLLNLRATFHHENINEKLLNYANCLLSKQLTGDTR
jgi:hypothetical protein